MCINRQTSGASDQDRGNGRGDSVRESPDASCPRSKRVLDRQHEAGDPVVDKTTTRSVHDVIECLTAQASKHGSSFRTMPLPQGATLDFADSNVIKVREDNGTTTYRFYAGKRHVSNLWLENIDKTCAP